MDVFIIFSFFLFALILYVALLTKRPHFPHLPGPGLLEYFPKGSVYQMLRDASRFTHILGNLAAIHGDIFSLWLGTSRVVVTAVEDDIKQIMTFDDDFERPQAMIAAFGTVAPGGIFTMPRAKHRKLKRTLKQAFNHGMLRGFHLKND